MFGLVLGQLGFTLGQRVLVPSRVRGPNQRESKHEPRCELVGVLEEYRLKALDRCYKKIFACNLTLCTEYHKKVLEAIIYLAMSDILCTCNDASAMVYLWIFTCDGN